MNDNKLTTKESSIIFYLDSNLKVYRLDLVNSELKLIDRLEKLNGRLDLSSRFDSFWKELYAANLLESSSIAFIIGNRAGFNDTRIIYIWLKSHMMFNNTSIKTKRVDNKLSQDEVLQALLSSNSDFVNIDHLSYSHEPRIGK
ncbi:MAG: hypothetical protein AAGF07_00815 [Patescibacteria group bacterium]